MDISILAVCLAKFKSLLDKTVPKHYGAEYSGKVLGIDDNGDINPVSGSAGTMDHRALANRDSSNQHPISAISGLSDILADIPSTISDLSQDENHRTVTDSEKVSWNGKFNTYQGTDKFGQILMVGQNGNIAPFDIYTPSYDNIMTIANIVRNNTVEFNKKLFPVGDQIIVPWRDVDDDNHKTDGTAYPVAWDIVHHGLVTLQDGSVVPGMFLQMHRCSAYGVQFSHEQAFFQAFSKALPAGTYNVTFGVKYDDTDIFTAGTTGQFTLTQNLPIGGKLLLNGGKVEAWASATATSATESVDLTVGAGGTSLGSITSNNARSSDGLNAMYRIQYGHGGRWSTSGIRQYLNASGQNWFSSKEDFDIRPDEYAKHGFMSGFNSDFLSAIKPIKVTTGVTVESVYQATTEDTFDTFFLPARVQMNMLSSSATAEGDAFDYWKQRLDKKIPAINDGSAQSLRLRGANPNVFCTWAISYMGQQYSGYASASTRFTPVCVIC